MKKTLISILAVVCLFCGPVAFAGGGPDMLPNYAFSSVPTNATAAVSGGKVTNESPTYGWFDTAIFDIGGQTTPSPTVTVSIVTVADRGTGPARTILSAMTRTG